MVHFSRAEIEFKGLKRPKNCLCDCFEANLPKSVFFYIYIRGATGAEGAGLHLLSSIKIVFFKHVGGMKRLLTLRFNVVDDCDFSDEYDLTDEWLRNDSGLP